MCIPVQVIRGKRGQRQCTMYDTGEIKTNIRDYFKHSVFFSRIVCDSETPCRRDIYLFGLVANLDRTSTPN